MLAGQGEDRSARRAVADEVESQIREQLAQRTSPSAPKLADLEALLAEMDPPEAYGQTPTTGLTSSFATAPRLVRRALVGAIIGVVVPLSAAIVAYYGAFASGPTPQHGAPMHASALGVVSPILAFVSMLLMIVFGITALTQINASQGQLYGKALAIFDIIFWPILCLLLLLFDR